MNYPPAQDRRRPDGQPTSKSPVAPIMQIALALGAVMLLAVLLEFLGGA